MDRNFDTDNFERLLREKSDEFRMYPSKRIWHSIYNNIHPGRKWPSVAMSITLITALFLVGYLNTKNTNVYTGANKSSSTQSIILAQTNFDKNNPANLTENSIASIASITTSAVAPAGKNAPSVKAVEGGNTGKANSSTVTTVRLPGTRQMSTDNISGAAGTVKNISSLNQSVAINTPDKLEKTALSVQYYADVTSGIPGNVATDEQPEGLQYAQKTAIDIYLEKLPFNETGINGNDQKSHVEIGNVNTAIEKKNLGADKKNFISAEDRAWIENYALYNRPATKKWANKISWELYATPSVVYRKLFDDVNFGNQPLPATPLQTVSRAGQDVNETVVQKPSFGVEIGTGFLYAVSKRIKLKMGLQLNYTRYNSAGFQNTHPFATKLTMHDYKTNVSYEEIRNTPYSNMSGVQSVMLHNETFQIALPIGADVKLLGNNILQWNVGATIQPTYVFGGKSFLISSDRRNYVKESSMLNKWNLNAGFETFVSYKASSGITFQFGPQFRTQLFTTNHKQIAVEEKLNSYGLKFGISKTLK